MDRIEVEVVVNARPEQIIEALENPKALASWWTDDIVHEGGVGTLMSLGFPTTPDRFELRVEEIGAHRVRWTALDEFPPSWKESEITWSLLAAESATLVRVVQEGVNVGHPSPASLTYVWAQLLRTLKAYVEDGAMDPYYVQVQD